MDKPLLADVLSPLLTDVERWVQDKRSPIGFLNTNVMTVGLNLSTRMRENFPIPLAQVRTPKGQVRGLSGLSVSRILRQFGEERPFTSEGGRTSRGSIDLALELMALLNRQARTHGYEALDPDGKDFVSESLQRWFVKLIQVEYFDKQRIAADIDPTKPAHQAIRSLLVAASERGGNTAGAVAQHLVGAKLALRFPELIISNDGYTTADQQTSRAGDFQVEDTAFHVTMSPSESVMAGRCRDNIRNHFRPVVLVPEDRIVGARQIAETTGVLPDISVISIETFVGLNIEEMATFSGAHVKRGLRRLLEAYNERVSHVEPNPSLQIEIPTNL